MLKLPGEHVKPKFPWVSGTNTISPTKKADTLNNQPIELSVANVDDSSSKSNTGKDEVGLSGSGKPQNKADCNGSTISKCNSKADVSSSSPNIATDPRPSFLSVMKNRSIDDNMWHYRDPSGNVQGPFSMVQLQKWSPSGYFPADMRIWSGREADSLLLNNALQECFHNNDGRGTKNVACNRKDDNQVENVTVRSEIPSSTILATPNALDNSVNIKKIPNDLNCDPQIAATLTMTDQSTEQLGIQKMPDINQHVTSVFTVADTSLVNLPSPLLKKESHDNQKIQDSGDKEQSKLLIQDSGIQNMPDINHVSSVFTVADTSHMDLPQPLQKKESYDNQKIRGSGHRNQSKLLAQDSGIQNMPDMNHVSSVFTVADTSLVDLPRPLQKKESYDNQKIRGSGHRNQSKLLAQDSGIQNMPDINHVSSVFTVADTSLVDLPRPLQKKESYDNQKIHGSGHRNQSKLLDQDSGIQNMPDINQHISSVFNVADAACVDLPRPLQKKESYDNQKVHGSGHRNQSKLLVQDSRTQNMPDINQHISSVFNVADAACVDLPNPLAKKESHESQKIQDSGGKEQPKLVIQDSGIQNMPDINQHVSSVFTVSDAALVDLPNPLQKKESHENQKVQDFGDREQSKLLVQNSGNTPGWSTNLSLVVGGTQLPETGNEWGRYPPTVDHQVATTNSTIDQTTSLPSWHGLGETIEFSTLAEESVSDLLAEVDAMESRNCVPSPTSRRNSFLEDLFNGSIDDFSPTADQGTTTRSDGFSSTADIHLNRQSTGLQFSFGLETKPTCAVSIPQTSYSDNIGFKWAEMSRSELHPPRQDMIDLNDSSRVEADEGERETIIEEKSTKSTSRPMVMAETRVGRKSKEKGGENIKAETTGAKIVRGYSGIEKEEGEFVQPEAAPPPLPPLLPLPRPPPPPAMALDTVDSRRSGSARPSQGTTSTGRVHAHMSSSSRSGNVVRDSHHRRSGGDRYNSNSSSPRERSHHVEDSGYSRSSKASWSRQSSFGSGGVSSGGGGSGYSRPPLKGQRICKFYESGRCRKGSSCTYLHPQDR
ncbi:hypothetical protein QVD17_06396 [Tagetes erecta]|uniref:Uncharacterized protein n=1 Tax=Tagetes erecta TaxID=13708 RepID=A0AAD8PC73_TARER|nr:hypothetical protein QVD17_06396 [Tagetes erecta]